ncbi:alpha/beta hydrolase-fold protein [Microvirga sp. W0021]|uniref:Alpha/beta hydrolase-fold protein n=1 Tax=Hohaiivirga grylli TaxID=3133970 RepID=A0ABV0BM26_9HYPH
MRYIILILSTISLFSLNASALPSQDVPPISAEASERFTISQYDIATAVDSYRIYLAIPKTAAPDKGYPALYLLDANLQFPMTVNAYKPENGPAPVIVGIGYKGDGVNFTPDRTRDYTVPATGEDYKEGGKSPAFYHFIEDQVKPLVAEKVKTDPKRQTLLGHSFGGLFTLHVIFNHPEAFTRYVAVSPALWWGKGIVIPNDLSLPKAMPEKIIITVGSIEEIPDMSKLPDDPVARKRIELRRQGPKIRDIAKKLQDGGWPVAFFSDPGKNHTTIIPDAIDEALKLAVK